MKIKIGNKTFEVSKEELESNPKEITLEFAGTLRTEEEDRTFVENHKTDARKEGLEIAVKQYREEFGFKGRSIDNLIEAVKNKTLEEAKIEPSEKLKKANEKLQEKETALRNALRKVTEIENDFSSYKDDSKIDRKLDSYIPDNVILPREDMKLILKNKLNFGITEDGRVGSLDESGNFKKNQTTADVMDAKDVVEDFFKSNQQYVKGVQGGGSGSDSGSSDSKQTMDEFIKEQQDKDIQVNSEEFNKTLESRIKAGLVDTE